MPLRSGTRPADDGPVSPHAIRSENGNVLHGYASEPSLQQHLAAVGTLTRELTRTAKGSDKWRSVKTETRPNKRTLRQRLARQPQTFTEAAVYVVGQLVDGSIVELVIDEPSDPTVYRGSLRLRVTLWSDEAASEAPLTHGGSVIAMTPEEYARAGNARLNAAVARLGRLIELLQSQAAKR